MTLQKARIIGLGSYLPEKVLSNADLEKMVETSHEWIMSRTGIKERRLASPQESSSHMGTLAAKEALRKANLTPSEIDLILVATMTPDYLSPSTSALIQAQLGATAPALDIQAACSGYIYGLSMAKAFIESGLYRTILLIATEKMSSIIDYKDRNTCVLFGDGAAAAVISSKGEGFLIENVCLGADGSVADLLMIPGGGSRTPVSDQTLSQKMHFIKMTGKELFKHAVRRMNQAAQFCLDKEALKIEDISWFIPHQANARIIDSTASGLNFPLERVYKTLHKYGNTSASSVGIALSELSQEHTIPVNSFLLLVAFGAGLTWGASILKKVNS